MAVGHLETWRRASKVWRTRHPDRSRENSRRWYQKNRSRALAYNKQAREADSRRNLFSETKRRAIRKGIPFDLCFDEMEWPSICPALGVPMIYKRGLGRMRPDSPSIDRLIPSLGYIKGNVVVVSLLANQIKTYATPKQIRKVADYYLTLDILWPEEA